ncbi:uncharacterized protein C1orf146-like isoform X4 [Pocillopora damicornis]|uniref:uncharacterized protein C1orf146-like isoform X4 n=1 Tax=Pocillopora damicornis TaxID=46731 RepID=UPI000F558B13|nr:uncharacterized protein C1orf146-like isoform X4 [Pocillopora damicornis]
MADSVLTSWPVILNRSLENSDIHRLLMQYHKVRVTDTTGHGVIIFPLSSVAFMIMPLDQVLTENQEKHLINEDTIERIHKLNQLHRKAYVILVAAFMGPEQIKAWTALQSRFLGTSSRFIPAHSAKECFECMMTISKGHHHQSETITSLLSLLIDESVGNYMEDSCQLTSCCQPHREVLCQHTLIYNI